MLLQPNLVIRNFSIENYPELVHFNVSRNSLLSMNLLRNSGNPSNILSKSPEFYHSDCKDRIFTIVSHEEKSVPWHLARECGFAFLA